MMSRRAVRRGEQGEEGGGSLRLRGRDSEEQGQPPTSPRRGVEQEGEVIRPNRHCSPHCASGFVLIFEVCEAVVAIVKRL